MIVAEFFTFAETDKKIRIPTRLFRHVRRNSRRRMMQFAEDRMRSDTAKPIARIVKITSAPVDHSLPMRARLVAELLGDAMTFIDRIDGIKQAAAHKREECLARDFFSTCQFRVRRFANAYGGGAIRRFSGAVFLKEARLAVLPSPTQNQQSAIEP